MLGTLTSTITDFPDCLTTNGWALKSLKMSDNSSYLSA
ncbi:Uncharacterised protein [Vibrio cholerae]|nr:Uncharacterised protein [Vibrio cholerae]